MGSWVITIKGHGIHHNNLSDDADAIAKEAVDKLIAAGATVHAATIELTGGDYDSIGNVPESLLPNDRFTVTESNG